MKLLKSIALSALILSALNLNSPSNAQDGAVHVATANPSRILAQMKETQEKNETEKKERQQLDDQEKAKVKEIQDIKEQRDKFSKKNTPDWNEKTNQILTKSVELQTWVELKKAELTRRHKEEIKALFDKIQATIAQVAADKKIDLVIADYGTDFPEDLDALTPDQLHGLIRQKNVLFSAKGVDISADVTARLDASYK